MAKKISDLTPATQLGDNDSFVFNDVVAGNDKRVTAAVLRGNADVVKVSTISDLKNTEGKKDGQIAFVLGYSAQGDGGGGPVFWDSTSTESPNDGTIFQVNGVNTGRWKRPKMDRYSVRLFGAKMDGVTNDYDAFQRTQNAVDNIVIDNGTCRIETKITMQDGKKYILDNATIEINLATNESGMYDGNVACEISFEGNGVVKRIGSGTGSYALHIKDTGTKVNSNLDVKFISEVDTGIYNNGQIFDCYGESTLSTGGGAFGIVNNAVTSNAINCYGKSFRQGISSRGEIKYCTGISTNETGTVLGGAGIGNAGSMSFCVGIAHTEVGIISHDEAGVPTGYAQNCYGYSEDRFGFDNRAVAISCTGRSKNSNGFYHSPTLSADVPKSLNCSGFSDNSAGATLNVGDFKGGSIQSKSGRALNLGGSEQVKITSATLESGGDNYTIFISNKNAIVSQCDISSNQAVGNFHLVYLNYSAVAGEGATILNNTIISAFKTSTIAITSGSATYASIANNISNITVIGGNVTNNVTNSEDSQGNITI